MPIFDFAIIEVGKDLWPFRQDLKPVCLPKQSDWREKENKFSGEYVEVTGYGRVDQLVEKGRDQNSCDLKKAYLKVMPSYNKTCTKVRFMKRTFCFL